MENVELVSPPRRTTAMGAWISLPGSPAASTMGTSARPAVIAVIRMGTSRFRLPK